MDDTPAPRAHAGAGLAAGALVLLAAAALFGAIAEGVVAGARITTIDAELARWLHAHATPALTRWVLLWTNLNSTVAVAAYGTLAALCFAFGRHWRRVATLVVGIAGILILNVLMKLAFHRARPAFDDPLVTLATYSFPSGHVAGSTVLYGLGVAFVFGRTRRWPARASAVAVAVLCVALVAFTRLYLGAHFLSDVAAGFAEGVAWLAVTLAALHACRRRPERR